MIEYGPEHGKPVGTREWYNFVALLSDIGPDLHPGGVEATRTLLRMVHISTSDQVLDVGCGSGATAISIAREVGARVTGIDLSEAMIAKARQRAVDEDLTETLRFEAGDVFHMGFDDGTFDAVLFQSLLTVIPGDPGDALGEMVRVLRPNGRLGGNEATIDHSVPPKVESLLAQHPATHRTFTPASLRQAFEDAGLGALDVRSVPAGASPAVGLSDVFQDFGLGRILAFFLRTYPRLLWRLLSDPRFRQAHRIDDQVTDISKEYLGYTLIVGRKHPKSPNTITG